MAIRILAAALLIGTLAGSGLAAEPTRAPTVKTPAPPGPPRVAVTLLGEGASIEPGASFWVGLRQRIAPGWHTYWTNPGDSGEPPVLDWDLPAGWQAGPLVFPQPERMPVGPLMSYGYTGEVVLLTRLTAPAGLAPGASVTLRGHAAWLVCEKICIPEEADVTLTLPVVAGKPAPGAGAAAIERTRRAVPVPSPWPASLSTTPEAVTVSVAAPGLEASRIAEIVFFPGRWGVMDHAAAQEVTIAPDGIKLRAARGLLPEAADDDLDGVLVIREKLDQGLVSQAFAIKAVAAKGAGGPSLSLLAAMGLAVVGGLILNLMPCVLPVLSIKALALVGHAEVSPGAVRRHGLAYTAGVLVCFAALAGALLALRAGGAKIGWGFQLQSPLVVTALAYVLFALGLSLSGLLVIGGRLTGVGHGLAARPGYARLLLHGRARHRRRHPVHGTLHGRGGGLRADPAAGGGARGLRGPRARPGPALPRAEPGPGVATPPAAPGSVDDAALAGARLPALRLGRVARLGGQPPGRARRRWRSCWWGCC